LIAGLTVAAISFPQAMAYALIAGVDSRFGVYSAIDVTIVASIFGSSSHLINGPTSAISLLVFTALAFIDSENSKELFEALFLLAVLVGAFQIVISLFKLGNLTRYISESVIIGFMTAAAFLLAIGQLGNALGVRDKGNGHMQVLRRVWLTLTHDDHINYRALTLSVAAVILAVVLRKLVQRYGWPQVDMLAVLVITALIAYIARWSISGPGGHTAVSVGAKIPRSLPGPHVPKVHPEWLPHLSTGALAIAFVGIIEALSIAKAIAYQTQQQIDYNRQIMDEGLANLTGGSGPVDTAVRAAGGQAEIEGTRCHARTGGPRAYSGRLS
jgi:SulP family sulfate permease